MGRRSHLSARSVLLHCRGIHWIPAPHGIPRLPLRAPLKTPSEKKQLCTASAASSPLVVRKHAFKGFPCIYCTYLFFLTQNGFLEMP